MTTIAGTGVINLYHAPSRRNVVIDFLDQAGSGAHADMFAGAHPGEILFGYKSILVPTFVRGTQTAFEQFGSGRISWSQMLEPAIRYAGRRLHGLFVLASILASRRPRPADVRAL
jgi:gamma-glutamyltranspeptidase